MLEWLKKKFNPNEETEDKEKPLTEELENTEETEELESVEEDFQVEFIEDKELTDEEIEGGEKTLPDNEAVTEAPKDEVVTKKYSFDRREPTDEPKEGQPIQETEEVSEESHLQEDDDATDEDQTVFEEIEEVENIEDDDVDEIVEEKEEENYNFSLYEESKKKSKILENRYKKLQNESDAKKSKFGSKRHIDKKDHDAKAKVDAARLTGKDAKLAAKAKQAKSLYNKSIVEKEAIYIKKREVMNMEFIGEKYKGKFLFYLEAGETKINNIVFKNPELIIKKNTRVCIEGVNGAGKTTLLNYILETMYDNSISKEKIVYIPQDIDRDDWNDTFNNIKALNHESLGFLMSFVNRLGSNAKSVINSLNHSPGEMRKIMLGMAVIKNPYIIILDEPTNHLDIDSIERLEESLFSFNCALLIVSHNKNFLKRIVDTKWILNKTNDYTIINIENK